MAQDFYAAFNLGDDDRHISALDEPAVALAAIKGLYGEVVRRDETIEETEGERCFAREGQRRGEPPGVVAGAAPAAD
jgi:hypothetical protein